MLFHSELTLASAQASVTVSGFGQQCTITWWSVLAHVVAYVWAPTCQGCVGGSGRMCCRHARVCEGQCACTCWCQSGKCIRRFCLSRRRQSGVFVNTAQQRTHVVPQACMKQWFTRPCVGWHVAAAGICYCSTAGLDGQCKARFDLDVDFDLTLMLAMKARAEAVFTQEKHCASSAPVGC